MVSAASSSVVMMMTDPRGASSPSGSLPPVVPRGCKSNQELRLSETGRPRHEHQLAQSYSIGPKPFDGLRLNVRQAPRNAEGFAAALATQSVNLAIETVYLIAGRCAFIVRAVDRVLADGDQRATRGEVMDGAAVILGVDDGCRLRGERAEILPHLQRRRDRGVLVEVGAQRDWCEAFCRLSEVPHQLVDLLMQRIVEVMRIEERGHAVHRLVVDEDRAKQRLFGLQIVRGLAEGESG